jgi:hypothetical protein
MAVTPIPYINGAYNSFANIELRFQGFLYVGFKSINYGFKVGSQFVRGTNPLPLGTTMGQAEPRADCEIYLPQFIDLMSRMGDGFMQRQDLTFTVTYGNPVDNAGLVTVTDLIADCRIIEVASDNSESLDATVRKITFMPLRMLFNGVAPVVTSTIGALG